MATTADAQAKDRAQRLRELDDFEDAFDRAFSSGKADRAQITKEAQEKGLEALQLVGIAMRHDEEADEARRLAIVTEASEDRAKIRTARKRARTAHKEAKKTHRQATAAAKQSYKTIKYSEPGKLGFLRFVQVGFGIHIMVVLAALLLSSRDTIVYNSVTLTDWLMIIVEAVAFWLFANFYKAARPFMMAYAVLDFLVYMITYIVRGGYDPLVIFIGSLWDLLIFLYFWRSKRVKAVLVNDFSSLDFKPNNRIKVQRRGWPFVRNLIIYFIIFSVLGHWMEAAMCQLIRLGLVQGEYDPTNTMLWRDWLYPFPMEGAAVVIIAVFLYPLWQQLLVKYEKTPLVAYGLSFLANALTCSLIEFSMGLIVNADHQLWDYTDNFCNIMGQVCLQNALAFGVAASLITWFVYPMLERWLARVPPDIMNIAFVVIAVFGGILWSLYLFTPPESLTVPQADDELLEGELSDEDVRDLQITTFEDTLDSLQKSYDEDKTVTKEERTEAQERIDRIRAELQGLSALDGKAETELADAA